MVEIKEFRGVTVNLNVEKSVNLLKEVIKAVFSKQKPNPEATMQDAEPAIYYYEIHYKFYKSYYYRMYWLRKKIPRVLRGFIALSSLKQLKRHEGFNEEKENERVESISESGIFLTPIMAMFRGKATKIIYALEKHKNKNEFKQVYDSGFEKAYTKEGSVNEGNVIKLVPKGARHILYRITDPEIIRKVKKAMAPVNDVVIADGHHRYGALIKMNIHWAPVFFVNTDDNDLLLLSWHRVINAGYDRISQAMKKLLSFKDQFKTRLYRVNNVEIIKKATHPQKNIEIEVRERKLYEEGQQVPSGAKKLQRDEPFRVTFVEYPEEKISAENFGAPSFQWLREVPGGGIQKYVIFGLYLSAEFILGRQAKYYLLSTQTSIIDYTKKIDELISEIVDMNDRSQFLFDEEIGKAQQLVNSGRYKLAILVPILTKSDVFESAIRTTDSKHLLPETLTCFYPKPGDGIIMCRLEDLRE